MDALFPDAEAERLPPEQTRLLDLRAEPYPDGRRLRVGLELTPFAVRPELELTLVGPGAQTVAEASIIEPMSRKLELTLHRKQDAGNEEPGAYTLTAILSYPHLGEVDRREISLTLPLP